MMYGSEMAYNAGWMGWGMGLFGVLTLALVVLSIAALVKYLVSSH